jgi:CRP-like cAMP-binding protein
MKDMTGTTVKYFRPGQYLFAENDPAVSLFVIKKGTVSVRKRKHTSFIEIARIYANEVVGELGLFDHAPRSASAMALTEVEAVELKYEALEKIFKDVPDYFKTIVAAMAERLRRADDMIRRLDHEVAGENESLPQKPADDSAADVLAATADVLGGDEDKKADADKKEGDKTEPETGEGAETD